jgi:predicted O-methyltransferase YrrM
MASAWRPAADLASGAHAASTFPNNHLLAPVALRNRGESFSRPAAWSAPRRTSPVSELRQAVCDEDWERRYEEGSTKICMRAEWAADEERCSLLQCLAIGNKAQRVLEVGSFCGVGALSLAHAIPQHGEVHTLELDPFVVEFGRPYQMKSGVGHKIRSSVGTAEEGLERLAREAKEGRQEPFDLVVVDADKEGMRHYFDVLWKSEGLLSERAIVCVDMTPFKGQVPTRYARYGFPYRWEGRSGEEDMKSLRAEVKDSAELVGHEVGRMLIVRRKQC